MHALLRSYGNPAVIDLIGRLNRSDKIDKFFVVVDTTRDTINTPALLETLDYSDRIEIVRLEDYGWSRALNAAIRVLPPITDNAELLLVISNEVQITNEEIDLLMNAASKEQASCGYALFDGWQELTYSLPRNTCIVWKRRLFDQIGLFDETFDKGSGTGTGMEDYEMSLRAFKEMELLPFIGPARVKLDLAQNFDLDKKLAWEREGILIIENLYSEKLVARVRSHIELQNEYEHLEGRLS